MRILIIKPSSLGDVVHALPTVNLIRRQFPEAHLAWLINTEWSSLLKNCPVLDERIEFQRRGYSRLPGLVRRLRAGRFDLVVDLQGLLRSGLFGRLSGARRRLGLSDAREGANRFHTEVVEVPRCHAVDRYLLAAAHLGCGTSPIEFPIGSSPADVAVVEQALAGREALIALNPLARWETKIWGDDKFSELLDQLPRERVVLLGSKAEAARIEALSRGRVLNLAGLLDLAQLAELYRRCLVVLSNDTGPMHLAAAVGTPVVALFGPTDPGLVGPYGSGHTVIRASDGRLDSIRVGQVLAAVEPFLAKQH